MKRDRTIVKVGMVAAAGVVGLAVLGLLGLYSMAEAHLADGGNTGVIHACMDNDNGKLKIVKPLGSCKVDETPVHWLGAPGAGPLLNLGPVVLDTRTGRMWEKKTTTVGSGANLSDLHDVDNTYTWCAATGDATAGTSCQGNTTSWITQVNAEAFAGFTDWRVPTRDELAGILLAAFPCGTSPCIDPVFGPTASSFYWSGTAANAINAWDVNFSDGDVFPNDKINTFRVRAVRGGP